MTNAERRVLNAVARWKPLHKAYWSNATSKEIEQGKVRDPGVSRDALRNAEHEVIEAQTALEAEKLG